MLVTESAFLEKALSVATCRLRAIEQVSLNLPNRVTTARPASRTGYEP